MTSSPRILFLDQSGALGGAELYLFDLVQAYRESSHVLLLESGPFYERLRDDDLSAEVLSVSQPVHDVRKQAGLWPVLRALPGLVRLVRKVAQRASEYDLIFANTQKTLLIGGVAGLLTGRPVVWNLHDLLTPEHFTAVNRWIAVTAANVLCTHVITNSHASRQAFEAAGGRSPVSVVYNGIDPAPFDAVSPREVEELRSELDLPGDAPVAGVFSRLAPWKGQHVLLEALPFLPPSTHILLVGDALFDGDQAYVDTLHRRVAEQDAHERIHFLGFRDDIPQLMSLCDVVVHTSVAAEPFGRVIVEGMLAERPVVATRMGGAIEIIEDDHTGVLLPPDDPAALGEALSSLFTDRERARRMAQAGAARARESFSLSAMHQGVQSVLDQVVSP